MVYRLITASEVEVSCGTRGTALVFFGTTFSKTLFAEVFAPKTHGQEGSAENHFERGATP